MLIIPDPSRESFRKLTAEEVEETNNICGKSDGDSWLTSFCLFINCWTDNILLERCTWSKKIHNVDISSFLNHFTDVIFYRFEVYMLFIKN